MKFSHGKVSPWALLSCASSLVLIKYLCWGCLGSLVFNKPFLPLSLLRKLQNGKSQCEQQCCFIGFTAFNARKCRTILCWEIYLTAEGNWGKWLIPALPGEQWGKKEGRKRSITPCFCLSVISQLLITWQRRVVKSTDIAIEWVA